METCMPDRRWIACARGDALADGEMLAVVVEGRAIALYRVEGTVHATDDRCTHGDARLSEGFLIDHCIECPLHQGQFDVRTGAPLCEPVTEPVPIHAVRELGGAIEVALDAR
jgi:naphthalene 1,2-dioxygenase system ferredoxin subunit